MVGHDSKFTLAEVLSQTSQPLNTGVPPTSVPVQRLTFSVKPLQRSALYPMHLRICQQPTSSFANVHFKPKDIRNILCNLDPAKATGPDETPTKVLREFAAKLASPLSHLFQILFSHGMFPKQWKYARVISIHKRDSKSDPTNYRPISLLSVLSKVMESSVHKHNL